MRAVSYGRVSRVRGREGDSFLSPVQQREANEAYVAARGGQVVAHIEDHDVSGGTIERPGFQRALAMIEAGDADTLVCSKLDRFGRTLPGIFAAVERIEGAGGHAVFVNDGIDLTTDAGRLTLGVLASVAEFELRRLKAGWVDVHERNVAAGIPTRYPWGYERAADRTLVPTPEGRRYVPAMFERRAAGEEYKAVARWLNEEGVASPSGGRWTGSTIAQLVGNRAYLGEVRYGDLVNDEAHEALVDLPLFMAAQVARPRRSTASGDGGLLVGLVRCAGCRYALDYSRATRSRPWAVYRCNGGRAQACPQRVQVKADDLEAHVVAWAVERWEEERLALRGEHAGADVSDANARLDRARAARAAYLDDPTMIVELGAATVKAQVAKLDAIIAEAERELGEAATPNAGPPEVEAFHALPLADRRSILAHGIDAVFLRGRPGRGRKLAIEERALVLGRGHGPDAEQLPRRGYTRPLGPWPWPVDGPNGAG